MTTMAGNGEMPCGAGRKLPAMRIASLFINLNIIAALLTLGAMVLGFFVPVFKAMLHYHIIAGLGAVVLGLFALVAVMFYLFVTGGSIKEAVMKSGLPVAYYHRTKPFKKALFPFCMMTITLLITMTVLGGAVHVGKVDKNIHLIFALVTALSYYYTIRKVKEVFKKDAELIADALDAIATYPPANSHSGMRK